MLTVFELTGSMDVVGDSEFEQITDDFRRAMASYFQKSGHSIEFSFERDPDSISRKVKSLMQPAYDTCDRIGLDLKDMLDDRCDRVASLCSHESCYVLLYTHLSSMAPDELKREMEAHKLRMKEHNVQPMLEAQSVTAILKGILHRHETFVDAMERDFLHAKLHVERLSTHEAARSIRQSYDRRRTDPKWKPVLPGDNSHRGKCEEILPAACTFKSCLSKCAPVRCIPMVISCASTVSTTDQRTWKLGRKRSTTL